ncbi:hypothetical protein AXF42_Ash010689 [Apostasia shenzhenica]|uniref:Replication factor A C-terminal domain-containing protein n=1 Tax=Apostasia shenzhenica TaxID=1088818 RepID=A0A2I0A6S2_9ASPA|nr:hypothetical protein AXF42_Ash010689 [Apostasia shenzhenica]
MTIEDATSNTSIAVFGEQAEQVANITINSFEAMKIEGQYYNSEERIKELYDKWFYFNVYRYAYQYKNISRITLSTTSIELEDCESELNFNQKKLLKT